MLKKIRNFQFDNILNWFFIYANLLNYKRNFSLYHIYYTNCKMLDQRFENNVIIKNIEIYVISIFTCYFLVASQVKHNQFLNLRNKKADNPFLSIPFIFHG
ncbi:hypothetical protein EDEG_00154 [Edhazardia aedis USNM 41457]|uniref:Uncharacterized protein n=1 Tax=Edhazardia aedis (strain USNM 41457) TaxID=1003232 RepID=J8ZX32_EDHAE|nr:hypothetical protein EDEG_00154 [Edhazardia aedis USNM 41457]|eukprot:EJW04238.1 hypothetical protein EDEG_00154 [Edhazardia aedis USNM 41457]